MLSDLKYALRQLAKNRGFTFFAVLTLALGIGANTAIFTAIHGVLISALPVKAPDELVFLTDPENHGMSFGGETGSRNLLTMGEFQDLREHNDVFSGLLAVSAQSFVVPASARGEPGPDDTALVSLVSGSYFSVLGVEAARGRVFGPKVDGARGANAVAVISNQYWQTRLGGDPTVLGQKLHLRNTVYIIVGVAPANFAGETIGSAPDVWVPLTMQEQVVPGRDGLSTEKNPLDKAMWLQAIGRLKPGVSVAQAKASANVTFQQYLQSQLNFGVPVDYRKTFLDQHLDVSAGRHGGSTVRSQYRQPLIFLMVLVGLILLIACANVANLLLTRATVRQKEIAIRVALGAKPARVVRQLLTESLILALLGGGAGMVLAQWGDAVLLRLVGQKIDLRPNLPMLLFTAAISVAVGFIFGVAPAWQATRVDLNAALRGIGGGNHAGRPSTGKLLLIAQLALAVALVVAAGLFVHSFQKLTAVAVGFDREHLLQFSVTPTASGYEGPEIGQLYQKLSAEIRTVPGVHAVSFSGNGLFAGGDSGVSISIEGYALPAHKNMHASFDVVGPNYFSTVGIPLVLGREIGPEDVQSGQRYGVINQTMAKYYFGDSNPIGRRIRDAYTATHLDFVVAGVVADAKQNSVRERIQRRFYVPFFNPMFDSTDMNFVIRARGDPATLVTAIRNAVKRTAPDLPAADVRTLGQSVADTLGTDRLLTELSGFFGALAALLAAVGVFGLMSYSVARRTREIGIRMALGSPRAAVLRLILGESVVLAAIGVGIGVPVAIGAQRLIAKLLFGLTGVDGLVLAGAAGAMVIVAALASYLPARRASQVDPLVALRTE